MDADFASGNGADSGGKMPSPSAANPWKRNAAAPSSWQRYLADAVRDVAELGRLLRLPALARSAQEAGGADFPLLVPRPFVARMRVGDPNDPLLRQVLPTAAEACVAEGFVADPLGETDARRAPALLHKYHGRALLLTTRACGLHCRYCFRRHAREEESALDPEAWKAALAAIAADASLHEIILSGGDPLMVDDNRLAAMARELAAIRHLRRLRVHTRLPVVIPARVTDELIAWLTATRLTPIVVVHVNHANELDAETSAALRRLVRAGLTVLNQSVLLRGVNDSTSALAELCERLIDLGILPYYLHALDPVAGAAHFAISDRDARQLIDSLRALLPGYAVPRLVRERPGEAWKETIK